MSIQNDSQAAASVVSKVLSRYECQPVLFIGSGLARRYMGTPDWEQALRFILAEIGQSDDKFDYLKQKHSQELIDVGTEVCDLAFEWAWGAGKSRFPTKLFDCTDKAVFAKYILADAIHKTTPPDRASFDTKFDEELKALVAIRPHALITTNYDLMLERIFDGYEGVVGKSVLRYNLNAFGEVYHIHGHVSEPETMILVRNDYDDWTEESKYFAAKLLTYFAEHPVFIFGYGLGDPNVKTVLRDIGKIVANDDGVIENVVQILSLEHLANPDGVMDTLVQVEDSPYKIRVLTVESLQELYLALQARHELKAVNPAMVRALAARVMKITRTDIPTGRISVNYKNLERVISSGGELPALLGLTETTDVNLSHPFLLSQVAEQLGMKNWHVVKKYVDRISQSVEPRIDSYDNAYTYSVKTGKKDTSRTTKYSQSFVDMIRSMQDGTPYEVSP